MWLDFVTRGAKRQRRAKPNIALSIVTSLHAILCGTRTYAHGSTNSAAWPRARLVWTRAPWITLTSSWALRGTRQDFNPLVLSSCIAFPKRQCMCVQTGSYKINFGVGVFYCSQGRHFSDVFLIKRLYDCACCCCCCCFAVVVVAVFLLFQLDPRAQNVCTLCRLQKGSSCG